MDSFADSEGRQWHLARKLPLSQDLSALTTFLRQQGINHRITEAGGGQAVWVEQATDLERVNQLLRGLESGELALQARGATEREATGPNHNWQSFVSNTGLAFRNVPLTFVLLGLSALGWLVGGFGSVDLLHRFTFIPEARLYEPIAFDNILTPTEIWRLWTPMFLHFTSLHIVFNALFLWVFGGRIEFVLGTWRFLLFVLLAGFISNAGQYLWQPDVNFGGMSGVNYAFIGYLWLRQILAPHPALAVPMGIIGFMLVWLLLGVFGIIDFFIVGGIANGAHVCGLLVGVTWGAVEGSWLSRRRSQH